MERVRGIEPLALAWKAKVLPLYDTRINCYGGLKMGELPLRRSLCEVGAPTNGVGAIRIPRYL